MKACSFFILIAAFSIVTANPRPIGFMHESKPAYLQTPSMAVPPVTITAQDLQGFWTIDPEDSTWESDDSLTYAVEYFFNGNGTFDYRFHIAELSDGDGQTPKVLQHLHASGTWRVDADSLYFRFEDCMEIDDWDCLDSVSNEDSVSNVSLASMEMKISDGRKTIDALLYGGPTPNFTIPSLLPSSIFKSPAKRPQVARSSLVFRYSPEKGSGAVLDLAGRRLSSRTAGGISIIRSPAP